MSLDTDQKLSWIWRIVAMGVLIAINFVSVAYYAGDRLKQVDQNTERIIRTEAALETIKNSSVTKEQFNDLKMDLKEIKADVKELNRRK